MSYVRLEIENMQVMGPIRGVHSVTGCVTACDWGELPQRPISRPVDPDEPDPETEVGYSRNALEPTTLVYQDRKVELTLTLYKMFRYVYDLCRTEGKTEFEFSEVAEAITGDPCSIGKNGMESSVKRIRADLAKLKSPLDITFKKEVIYVEFNFELEK